MTPPNSNTSTTISSNFTIPFSPDEYAAIQLVAAAAGVTPEAWATQHLVRACASPDSHPLPAPPTPHVLLTEVLVTKALVKEALKRSVPGAPPLTQSSLAELLLAIRAQSSDAAADLLKALPLNGDLRYPKG